MTGAIAWLVAAAAVSIARSWLLDRPQRMAMFALYAFARITDDLGDEPAHNDGQFFPRAILVCPNLQVYSMHRGAAASEALPEDARQMDAQRPRHG